MCKDGVLANRKEHRKLELKGLKKKAGPSQPTNNELESRNKRI